MIRAPSQLPLELSHPPQYGRDSFIEAASNRAALKLIERWPDWPAPVVVLSGPEGSGKTHLARIWAASADAAVLRTEELEEDGMAANMRGHALLLDGVEAQRIPERPLFHLINAVREAGSHLLITSRATSAEWRVGLPDLKSRLRLAAPAVLDAPDDDLLRQVLVKLFADRQLIADKAALDYLLPRMERSLAAAAVLVEALDREALASASGITRPLAARVLARSAFA